MAQRTFTLIGTVNDITDTPLAGAAGTVQPLTPGGLGAIDGNGTVVQTEPKAFTLDNTGSFSLTVDYPGDFQTPYIGTQIRLIINGVATDSPVGFAYASSINYSTWIAAPVTAGKVIMRAVYTKDDGTPIAGAIGSVAISQPATVVASGALLSAANPVLSLSLSDGTMTWELDPNALLNPTGLDYGLTITNPDGSIELGTWFFTVPTVVDTYLGAWNSGTAYVAASGANNGNVVVETGVLYRCILGHTNHVPPNATYWQVVSGLPTDLITAHLQGSALAGQMAIAASNIAASATVPGSVIGSPVSVQDILSNLLYVDAYGDLVVKSKTANYTQLPGDDALVGDASGGSFTFTLDSPATHAKITYVVRKDSSAATLSLAPPAGKTINGSSSALSVPGGVGYALLPVSSTDWRIVASYGDFPTILHNGTAVGTRNLVNLIDGANTTLTVADNSGASRVDVTVASNSVAGLSNQAGSYSAAAQPGVEPDSTSLIDRLRGGYHSNSLGNVSPAGFREFDLQIVAGVFYIAYDDYSNNRALLRHASTIAGLPGASNDTTVPGSYPSLYYDGTLWHVFTYDTGGNSARHYTNTAFGAGFTLADSPMANRDDVQMRLSPVDGKFYMACLDVSGGSAPYPVKMLQASTLVGPGNWTDLGDVFSGIGYPPAAVAGVFDPTPAFWNGRAYLLFSAALTTTSGRIAIVELDHATMKAIGTVCVIVEPLEAWQQQNSSSQLSNPILLAQPGQFGRERVYYTQKPNASVASPWGYVEAGPGPNDGRRPNDFLRLDTTVGTDIAAGLVAATHGGATWSLGGLVCSATPSGAFGYLAAGTLGDFTLAVQFSIPALPGSDGLLLRASPLAIGSAELAIYITSAGLLKAKVFGAITVTLTGVTTLAVGTVYRVTLRRLGSAIVLFLGSNQEASGTEGTALIGMAEWSIANDKGASQAAGEQLLCTVFGAVLCGEALPLSADPLYGLSSGGSGGGASAFASLVDVSLSGLHDGDLAIYRTSDGKWHNVGPASPGSIGWAPVTDSSGNIITDSTGACVVAPFTI